MDGYKYVITHEGRKHERNDPYAREVTQSNGHSLIIDPSFDWGDESRYRMPPWNELVILRDAPRHLKRSGQRSAGQLRSRHPAAAPPDVICHRYGGDALSRVIYTESHDEVANGRTRVPEEIWPGNADSWYSFGNALTYDTFAEAAPYDGMPASANVGMGGYSLVILSMG